MTPAMRMGLAQGPIAPEDILYFEPRPRPGRRKRKSEAVAHPKAQTPPT
jgi:hypothetical protein